MWICASSSMEVAILCCLLPIPEPKCVYVVQRSHNTVIWRIQWVRWWLDPSNSMLECFLHPPFLTPFLESTNPGRGRLLFFCFFQDKCKALDFKHWSWLPLPALNELFSFSYFSPSHLAVWLRSRGCRPSASVLGTSAFMFRFV